MTIIADTSGVLALIDESAREHADAHRVVGAHPKEALIMSPLVLAEIDYMVNHRQGVDAELEFLDEVRRGTYTLASWDGDDFATMLDVVRQCRDLDIGAADASSVVLAQRFETTSILTLDGHFRAIKPLSGGDAFEVLPADQP